MIAIARRPGVRYPDGDAGFSPSTAYPEYRHGVVAASENPVYALVRELLAEAGLDAAALGTPAWNPLGGWIPRGSRVFVLCNFVYHRRPGESLEDFLAKTTHGSVLRAVLDYVLLATGSGGRVVFGNAPLQSCHWDEVQSETGAAAVLDFYRRAGAPVEAADLRWEVTDRTRAGRVTHRQTREASTRMLEVDLGVESRLEDAGFASAAPAHFRVADYDPDRTESFHRPGSHRYVIHRDVLDADVIVSLPKLKTHEKVGITCVVKGFVGAVARKDCLAHHRFGDPGIGGDEYPPHLAFLRPVSAYHDWVHRRSDRAAGQGVARMTDRTVRHVLRRIGAVGGGAWYGNDTAWRMALDLARILHFVDRDGVLRDRPARRHLALIDGIIAGEGNGPLAPTAVDAGALVFSDGVLDADRAACRLMGFDPGDVPTIARATAGRWSLETPDGPASSVWDDGREVPAGSVRPAVGRAFRPPAGWRGHLGSRP